MNQHPLVSIITPSFNQGVYLEETILSVLNQTYPNIEYFIIDGGSTDNSVETIKKYEDNLSYWISEPDNGQAAAINKGMQKATGEYLCWINSDDTLYPDFIERRIAIFQNNEYLDFVYGDVDQGANIEEKTMRKGKQTDFDTMLRTLQVPIPQQSTIWRRKVLDHIGFLDEKWHVLLDREYFMRIARHFNILYVPGSVAFFRNHELSKSVNEEVKWADEIPDLYNEIFEKNIYFLKDEYIIRNKNKILSNAYLFTSRIYKKNDQNQKAKILRKKSLKLNPVGTVLLIWKNSIVSSAIRIKRIIRNN
jgi:glycosyltransferase involved in cell wall biosynthesis